MRRRTDSKRVIDLDTEVSDSAFDLRVPQKQLDRAQVASSLVDHQFGYQDIAVYDESMSQWTKDESLPIETG